MQIKSTNKYWLKCEHKKFQFYINNGKIQIEQFKKENIRKGLKC